MNEQALMTVLHASADSRTSNTYMYYNLEDARVVYEATLGQFELVANGLQSSVPARPGLYRRALCWFCPQALPQLLLHTVQKPGREPG